jgi:hypothetical protein
VSFLSGDQDPVAIFEMFDKWAPPWRRSLDPDAPALHEPAKSQSGIFDLPCEQPSF